MRYSKGVMWLDDCRIPFVNGDTTNAGKRTCNIFETEYQSGGNGSPNYETNPKGRFTPNLLVCDDMLNDGSTTKSGFNPNANIKQYRGGNFGGGKTNDNGIDYGDKGSNSRYYDLDKWFDKIIEKL
jgi:hypothetical protein